MPLLTPSPRHLATVAIAALCASPALLAMAQTRAVPASGFAGPVAGAPTLNRLIVKFKDSEATPSPGDTELRAARSAGADVRIRQLGERGARSAALNGDAASALSYVKSIGTDLHVATTAQRMNRADLLAVSQRLAQDPSVEYAEIDEVLKPTAIPNDPRYADGTQWSLQPLSSTYAGSANPFNAWSNNHTGSGVVVAVVDTGYRAHADLAANLLTGYDFVSSSTISNDGDGRDGDAQDPGDWITSANNCGSAANSSWHGTHVAGIIAAVSNNSVGMAGLAFGAKVLPVRVLGTCGGFTSDIVAGMRWAAGLSVPGVPTNANPAKVINLSLGAGGTCSTTFQNAVNAVRATSAPSGGSVVVVATGNDNHGVPNQPGNCSGVIAVTAHTVKGDNATYANIGTGTTLSAPGGGTGSVVAGSGAGIYSTLNAGTTTPGADNYVSYQGTSMATAHVSAAAAILHAAKSGLTPDAVTSALVNSARAHPAGTYCEPGGAHTNACGAGLLDVSAAVALVTANSASALPTVTAVTNPMGVVTPSAAVSLSGTATAPSGYAITSHQWSQVAGPSGLLSNGTTASASFVVPAVVAPGNNVFTFRYTATASNGQSASSVVSVQTNTTPVLATIPAQTVVVGGNLSFTASASDPDSGAVVAYLAESSNLPDAASFNASTGLFTWNSASPVGSYSITITPSDGLSSGTPQTVTITVTAATAAGGKGGGGATGWLEVLALLVLAGGVMGYRRAGVWRV